MPTGLTPIKHSRLHTPLSLAPPSRPQPKRKANPPPHQRSESAMYKTTSSHSRTPGTPGESQPRSSNPPRRAFVPRTSSGAGRTERRGDLSSLSRFLFRCLSGKRISIWSRRERDGGVPVVTYPHISQTSFDDDTGGSRRLPHGAQNTRVPREVVIGEARIQL